VPGDFILEFLDATEHDASPPAFKLWTAISLVGACAERRCWVRTARFFTFPNMYNWLVAGPGVGKQVLDIGMELVRGLPDSPVKLAPDSVTKASMVDALVKCKATVAPADGTPPIEYHSLFVITEEMQLFMPAYEADFLGVLNRVYNNPPVFEETRRYGTAREVRIPLPQINFLAGVQPGWMASTLPEVAWSTGLMARVMMIYVDELPIYDLYAPVGEQGPVADLGPLADRLLALSRRYGELTWEPDAMAKMREWHLAGGPPKPGHSKMVWYCNRRSLHLTKLTLISALSRGASTLTLVDWTRALGWLLDAEAVMPDIFRAMVGQTDQYIIEELHFYLTNLWKMNGGKAVHSSQLWSFATRFVKSDRVGKLLEAAERANVVSRQVGTDFYTPRPKHLHGVE
jgi:hypothetical protein